MDKQVKLSNIKGKDTFVRGLSEDAFKRPSTQSFEILSGEVAINQAEPFFKQNMVAVNLTRGGKLPGCAYPGAFIDPVSGNLHGSYEGPIPGQMVNVGFLNGNSQAPFVVNRYPYQGVGNTLFEDSFITPMYKAGFDAMDVLLGHFSGSLIGLYTGLNPIGGRLAGSIGIDAMTELNVTANTNILIDALVSAEVKSVLIKITGSTKAEISAPVVEINGNTKQFVTWTELNTALQSFIIAINALFGTKQDNTGAVGTLTLDISAAKTTTVLTG